MDELEKRIIWLAGFFDGEGTVTVFNHLMPYNKPIFHKYSACCGIVNTDPNLINECQKIFNELGVTSHIFVRKHQKENHSDAIQLNVRNIRSIEKLLIRLNPYLIGKKAQGELVLRFVQSRIKREGTGSNQFSPYNEEEKNISTECYKLNKKGRFRVSETKRQTPQGEDIVRTAGKLAELVTV